MRNIEDAMAIIESAKEEPFDLEGRPLTVKYAKQYVARFPPSRTIYFTNFQNGDLRQLRDFLGPLSPYVDNAWFSEFTFHCSANEQGLLMCDPYPAKSKESDKWLPSGLITCRTVEEATEIIDTLHNKLCPAGVPVNLRYARAPTEGEAGLRKKGGAQDRRRRPAQKEQEEEQQ